MPLHRLTIVPALIGLLALIGPSAASTAGSIVIYGSQSGTHLHLSESGRKLVVKGPMGATPAVGCSERPQHNLAECDLAAAEVIEVEMGPGSDFVEVDDALSRSLTVYLGAGSDKFIGNGEADTCYSGPSRRNRCIGGTGDDICITGNQNSDCVGGAGDDYCKHGNGSDGCWGGPGDDVCIMGAGQDGCHGEGGDDRLYGGPDPDQLYGGGGANYCNGEAGVGKSHECTSGPRR